MYLRLQELIERWLGSCVMKRLGRSGVAFLALTHSQVRLVVRLLLTVDAPAEELRRLSISSKPARQGSVKRNGSVKRPSQSISRSQPPPEDDFGDFDEGGEAGADFEDVDFGDFSSVTHKPTNKDSSLLDFEEVPLPSRPSAGARATGFFAVAPPAEPVASTSKPGQWYNAYKRRHLELMPYVRHLRSSSSPSGTLSLLFPADPKTGLPPTLQGQGDLLLGLLHFLSPQIQPLQDWGFLRQALLAAADRFDSSCLVAFEVADGKHDEEGMRTAAEASWKVWEAGGGRREEWECGRVWVEKREVFYETGKWDAVENIM